MNNVKNFANAIRCLSIDMVNEANSGHEGAPLGFADIMAVLFQKSMNFDPHNENRDRLILSSGHASAMLYSAIYLSGKTNLNLEDLKKFRKFGGICQGHPELNRDLGIEMTTGALGQGIATSVGFAISLKKKKINSKVFVICGDGDLMEGVSHESMTLASSLNLNNLIILFDNNNICIDGQANNFTTNNLTRFKAYGFEVFEADGHDYSEIFETIEKAKQSEKPAFISFKTIIGYPSKNSGTSKCHGKFLSDIEIKDIKKIFGFPQEPFSLPFEILEKNTKCEKFKKELDTEKLHDIINIIKSDFIKNPETKSTRQFGGMILSKLSSEFSEIISGSADLSESTCTLSSSNSDINKDNFTGNFIHYGIREHAMGCCMNGIAIEGFIPFGGTFLVFSDYMRPAIRNAAIMKIAPIFILTHDSIAVGEDGATHQPIEHLESLRAIPNLNVMRPSCDIEVAECFEIAIKNRETPTAMILSRQNVKNIRKSHTDKNLCESGIYKISEFKNNDLEKLTIIATGSEVSLALEVSESISKNFDVCIMSAPCLELIDNPNIISGKKLILEAGIANSWYKYTDKNDIIINLDKFGQSGTSTDLFNHFEFNVENIFKKIK